MNEANQAINALSAWDQAEESKALALKLLVERRTALAGELMEIDKRLPVDKPPLKRGRKAKDPEKKPNSRAALGRKGLPATESAA